MRGPASFERAIAYLKTVVPHDSGKSVYKLSHADSPVLKELGNGLGAAYLVDEGTSFRYVQYRELDHGQVDPEILHTIAVANLMRIAEAGVRVQAYQNIFAVFLDGNFEASLILVDDLWEETFRAFLHGPFAVAIPARDILAFGDASSPEAIADLQGVCDRLNGTTDHPQTEQIYYRSDRQWVPIGD